VSQPVFVFNPFFNTRLPVALAITTIGGIVAVLSLIPVGIYASQDINNGLIFLGFCLLLEVVIMKWLIHWYRKLILKGTEEDWNKRVVFIGCLFFLNCFLLWLHYV